MEYTIALTHKFEPGRDGRRVVSSVRWRNAVTSVCPGYLLVNRDCPPYWRVGVINHE